MDAARRNQIVARNLRDAVAGASVTSVAEAADTDAAALVERLNRDAPNVADLIGIGGFRRINPTEFLKGRTA